MFTKLEKRVFIFFCFLIVLGGSLKLMGVNELVLNEQESSKPSKVDINSASLVELDKLPLIGPKTAQAIIDYRRNNGSFMSLDDLKKVRGIGDKKLNILRQFIYIPSE